MNKITGDLKHILHSLCHIAVILEIDSNFKSYNDFMSNFYLIDVIVLRLQQIGENISKFSDDFKTKHNEIDYKIVKGFRNVAVHNYDGLDYERVYFVIKEDIPDLKNKYENIVINEFNLSEEFLREYINCYIENRIYKDIL